MEYRFNLSPVLVTIMLFLVIMPASAQDSAPEVIVIDGRISSINIESGQVYSDTWEIKENEWYSV